MTATITRRLVSLTDTADALAVSTRTVRRYIADGQLEAVRLGRKTNQNRLDRAIHRRQAGRQLAPECLVRSAQKQDRSGQNWPLHVPQMFPISETIPKNPL